ncbi:hypothetical protein PM082_003319 [Marasmius tenuissimus]|nr:hypothetical protein PM082_003319 [Marasmius tenuissimus]
MASIQPQAPYSEWHCRFDSKKYTSNPALSPTGRDWFGPNPRPYAAHSPGTGVQPELWRRSSDYAVVLIASSLQRH